MKKPVWGVLALCAGAVVVYALIAPQRSRISDLEIRAGLRRYPAGEEVPVGVATHLPREAIVSAAPRGTADLVPPRVDRMKKKGGGGAWLDLPDLQRAKLVKRGKRPEGRSLRYRFRVEKGWEIFRVPRSFRDKYTDTREALSLAKEARGETATTSSGREGYRITSIDSGSLLEEVGILPGDVILSVNDHPVTGPADGRRLYGNLKHEDRFWLVVDRDGEIVNLYYELEE